MKGHGVPMPNDIKKNDDGTLEVKLETGEIFTGDPLAVTQKMAEAHVNTKRWGQQMKSEVERLQSLPPPQPAPPASAAAVDPAIDWVAEQIAKKEGFSSWQERQQTLESMRQATENLRNTDMAGAFLYACPDFPNTPEAIDKLAQKVDQNGWEYSPQSMIAAHSLCVREKIYQPLTTDEQNMAANARSGGSVPPPPPQQNSVDNRGAQETEYTMDLAKLREMVLKGGK